MHRKGYWIGCGLIAAGLLAMGVARLRSGSGLPDAPYGTVPPFALDESGGGRVTLEDLRGTVWVADFIFTNCAGTCPLMSERMRHLQDSLPPEIKLVSFTVDPQRDTPSVLADSAKRVGADTSRWWFLTGDRESLYKLSIDGFKLALDDTQGTETEPITHSTRLVLVDQLGQIRGYYGGTDEEEMSRLAKDVTRLL
jgi:cytochrome oxidase Cu insertion factor (SCO1/SenC/PrrC family)